MLFVSHHKCASTLASRYVKKMCEINGLTFSGSSRGDAAPIAESQVNFRGNASYPFISQYVATPAVHIIRNPLNVAQSAYYSHLKSHPVKPTLPYLVMQRRILEQVSPEEGKLLTITFCERNDFFENTPGPLCALRQWNYDDQRFATLRMEDFGDRIDMVFRNALGAVADQYEWPDAAEFTFSAFSGGRLPGQIDENSPYRSGHPDTWRRELPKAGILYIREHYQGLLERFYPEALLD